MCYLGGVSRSGMQQLLRSLKRFRIARRISGPGTAVSDHQPYRTMAVVAQCTGLRAEEVLALEWKGY